MSTNVAVFEADIDTSKLVASSARARKAFDDIGSSGTRAFDSLQAQVQTLESKIERLEKVNQKTKSSFTQLSSSVTGLTTNLALQYFTWDNIDKVQLRATSSQRKYEEQLAKTRQMEKEGKIGTQEYAFELRQLTEMKERARQAQSDLTQANVMFGLSLATLATSTIPNSIKSIQGLNLSLQTVRTTLWTIATHPVFLAVTGFFLAWELGISKVIEKTAGLKDGEASIVQGLQRMWEGQNKVTSDGVSGFGEYTGTVGATSSAISSLGGGLDSVTEKTSKLITSYSQLVDLAKGKKGVNAGDVPGNVNDLRQKFALDELPANDFSNFDKFLDLNSVNFLREHDEKWGSIVKAINNANISTKEYQSNLQIRIKQSGMFADMKEYAEVIKDAHDVGRIKEFRREVQEMAKDFRLGKEQAKELSDIFSGIQKKSSDHKLKRTEFDSEKYQQYAKDLGFSSTSAFVNSLSANGGGDWAGLFMRRIQNMKRSGLLGSLTVDALETLEESLRTQGLINQIDRALDASLRLSIQGEARTIATAQQRFLDSIKNNLSVGQSGGLGIGGFGTSPTFRNIAQGGSGVQTSNPRTRVSGSARARSGGGGRSRLWKLQAELAQEANQRDYSIRQNKVTDLQSLSAQLGISVSLINPSLPSQVMVGGRGTGMRELWLAPWQIQASVQAQFQEQMREYQRQLAQAESQILERVSPIGITSIGSLSSILNNPLTSNDIQAQLDFQRRMASLLS